MTPSCSHDKILKTQLTLAFQTPLLFLHPAPYFPGTHCKNLPYPSLKPCTFAPISPFTWSMFFSFHLLLIGILQFSRTCSKFSSTIKSFYIVVLLAVHAYILYSFEFLDGSNLGFRIPLHSNFYMSEYYKHVLNWGEFSIKIHVQYTHCKTSS